VDSLVAVAAQGGFSEELVLGLDSERGKHRPWFVLLLGIDLTTLRAYEIPSGEGSSLDELQVILPEESIERLPAEHSRFGELCIGIVGLGSIGSKVAISLARSGFRKFVLVDDDVLVPENLCRHELTWAAVGQGKADAVRDELLLVVPNVKVQVHFHRVAGQESSVLTAKVATHLAACDLLVDATANPEAFLLIAALAQTNLRPICWGEVFAGGCGGLIARARPDVDPSPMSVRNAISQYLATLPEAPHRDAHGYNVTEAGALIAYDCDVGVIAAALSRLVVDIASGTETSQFPESAYLIGLRKEWIFSQPLEVFPIKVDGEGSPKC
jgi:molybdopterin/thiamine biosynthesis adenylyltransferase